MRGIGLDLVKEKRSCEMNIGSRKVNGHQHRYLKNASGRFS